MADASETNEHQEPPTTFDVSAPDINWDDTEALVEAGLPGYLAVEVTVMFRDGAADNELREYCRRELLFRGLALGMGIPEEAAWKKDAADEIKRLFADDPE
jgi:hypothetical protein